MVAGCLPRYPWEVGPETRLEASRRILNEGLEESSKIEKDEYLGRLMNLGMSRVTAQNYFYMVLTSKNEFTTQRKEGKIYICRVG
jgi:hypothetical protein